MRRNKPNRPTTGPWGWYLPSPADLAPSVLDSRQLAGRPSTARTGDQRRQVRGSIIVESPQPVMAGLDLPPVAVSVSVPFRAASLSNGRHLADQHSSDGAAGGDITGPGVDRAASVPSYLIPCVVFRSALGGTR